MAMRAYAIGALAMGLSDLIHSESDSTYTTDRLPLKGGVGTAREIALGAPIALVDRGSAVVTVGTPVSGSGGTVGNGAAGAWTADANAQEGTYVLVIIEPGSGAGIYEIQRPDGTVDGTGEVAEAYNGQINGTLADGSNDWVAGDRIPITVSFPTDGKVVAWDPDGTDGSAVCAGLCLENAIADVGVDDLVNVLTRGRAIIRRENIQFAEGTTDAEKQSVYDALNARGILCRVSG